jgi:cellobiose phosphorylase
MTVGDQRRIVHDLLDGVRAKMDELLSTGRVPEEWDGFELRWWLADTFQADTCKRPEDRRRHRTYVNEVIVRNL